MKDEVKAQLLSLHPSSFSSYEAGDDREQLGHLDGLRHVHLVAGAQDAQAVFGARVGRERNRRDSSAALGRKLSHSAYQLEAVNVRHAYVAHKHVGLRARGNLQRLARVRSGQHLRAVTAKHRAEKDARVLLVVHDENLQPNYLFGAVVRRRRRARTRLRPALLFGRLAVDGRDAANEARGARAATGERVTPADDCPEEIVGLKILVVDDEEDTRDLLRTVLGGYGAEVFVAATALEALEIAARSRPDVLVSDIGMPDVDGFELIRRVRELPAESGGGVPAIALTAYARAEDRLRVLRSGYQMHVPKPVEMAELLTVIASLVRRKGK